MDPACPPFQAPNDLKLLPIERALENINVRFRIGRRSDLLALKFLCHHAIMKLRFDGDRGDDVTVDEVVNEMLALAVFPLISVDGERSLTERIGIELA